LVNDSMVSDIRLHTREISKSAASDVAKPLSDIPNIDFEHVLICNKKITKGSVGNSKKVMICMAKALIPGFKETGDEGEIGEYHEDEEEDEEEKGEDLEVEDVDDMYQPRQGGHGTATASAQPPSDDDEKEEEDEIGEDQEEEVDETKHNEEIPTRPHIRLGRLDQPVCEFRNTRSIFLLAFPYLFQLGEGCNFKVCYTQIIFTFYSLS